MNIHWKDWCWSWSSNTLAIWCKEPTHWKRPWCWERLRTEEKRATEDEWVGWHQWFNGHEFEQTLGDSEGQGRLVCCSPWGCKESDTTEQLNNKEKDKYAQYHLPCGLKKKQTQRNREEKSSYQGEIGWWSGNDETKWGECPCHPKVITKRLGPDFRKTDICKQRTDRQSSTATFWKGRKFKRTGKHSWTGFYLYSSLFPPTPPPALLRYYWKQL